MRKVQAASLGEGLHLFDDLVAFTRAVEQAGFTFDFVEVTALNTSFSKLSEQYLIINIKDYDNGDSNNLLFLTEDRALLYSKKPFLPDAFKEFKKVLGRAYGRSTVLTFVVLDRALQSYKSRLEMLISVMKELEQTFDGKRYRDLTLDFERLYDRVEDFHDLVIRLEERRIKWVETRHISFDYSILTAENDGLLNRCRNRFNMLKDIARDNEMQVTMALNQRIEKLNNVVKRLTALTALLMMPTVISSHFGMNFQYMPELSLPFVYPVVITIQIVIVATMVLIFKRVKWL